MQLRRVRKQNKKTEKMIQKRFDSEITIPYALQFLCFIIVIQDQLHSPLTLWLAVRPIIRMPLKMLQNGIESDNLQLDAERIL